MLHATLYVLTLGASGAGFAALRFFTGLAEAPFFPGITLCEYISNFLPTECHSLNESNVDQ